MTQTGTELAERGQTSITAGTNGLMLTSFDSMWKFASCLARSGLAPKGIQSPEAIVIALQMGAEIGLPPMASLQNIAVINGRPAVYGDAQLAVVRGSGVFDEEGFDEWFSGADGKRIPDGTPIKFGPGLTAFCQVKRKGAKKPIVADFSYEDAQQANLVGKDGPWKQYPKRMLMWRARGYALRNAFTDCLRGMLSAEEAADRPQEVRVVESRVIAPPADEPQLQEFPQPGAKVNGKPSPIVPPPEDHIGDANEMIEPAGARQKPDHVADAGKKVEQDTPAIKPEPETDPEAEAPPADDATQISLEDALGQDWEAVRRVLLDAARKISPQLGRAEFEGGVARYVKLVLGADGRENGIPLPKRLELYKAMTGGKFDFAAGKIIKR